MASATLCAICHKRKAKRHCPGIQGEICAQCCGAEREVTVDCPFDCSYLRESRRYEADKVKLHAEDIPFPEIEVPDSFLYEHEQLIGQIGYRILRHGLENPRVVDNDVKEALDKLTRTHQTQASGIYYESLPEGGHAVGLFRDVKKFLDEREDKQRQLGGLATLKTSDVIRAFVFLLRLAMIHSNRRPRGRAFLDFLRQTFPEEAKTAAPEESRLIIPGR
jgi:hypothetical protein